MKKNSSTNNQCNENGNLVHFKDSQGYEKWYEYDENDNLIYYKKV